MDLQKFDIIVSKAQKDPEILAVVLYGSYVRNESYRDIDICLIGHPNSKFEPVQKRLKYLSVLPDIFDIQVFQNLPLYIRSRIIKEGKVLLNKDFDLLFDLYESTIKDYGLMLPHLNSYLEVD